MNHLGGEDERKIIPFSIEMKLFDCFHSHHPPAAYSDGKLRELLCLAVRTMAVGP